MTLRTILSASVFAGLLLSISPTRALAQGETTSAIVGQVADATDASIPGATVTITNRETGARRSAKTDEEGRFNFPQLKPGAYSVGVEAEGFEPRQNNNVFAGLGEKQTVNFTLHVAHSNQTIEVSGIAPLINPENPEHVHESECAGPGKPSQSWRRSDLPIAIRRGRAGEYGGQRQ